MVEVVVGYEKELDLQLRNNVVIKEYNEMYLKELQERRKTIEELKKSVDAYGMQWEKEKERAVRHERALEEIAYKGFNIEPKRIVVKMQSIARDTLVNKR